MTETQLPTKVNESTLNKLVLKGDLSGLTDTEKLQYYHFICTRLGLDPATKPFDFMVNVDKKTGVKKETLYLNKGGAEQLNTKHDVSLTVTDTKRLDDIYIVTARAEVPAKVTDANGLGALQRIPARFNESTGAVSVSGLFGDYLANAYMKAETKAKRRATISLLGLAMLDETEVETIPGARTQEVKIEIAGKFIASSEAVDTVETQITHVNAGENEPSMEDWEKVHKLVKDNKYPMTYFNVWKDRESKTLTPMELYEEALLKFGKPNKGGIAKDEVASNA